MDSAAVVRGPRRRLDLDTFTSAGRRKLLKEPSRSTRTASRSTTGGEIGAALAISALLVLTLAV
jgi:hypothetical protein